MAYTKAQKAEAVQLALDEGLAHAAREKQISKDAIRTWLKEAGHDPAELNRQLTERARVAAAASAAKRAQDVEQFKADMTKLLTSGAKLAAGKAIKKMQTDNIELPALVGMFTRSIHDLMLLSGEATTRTELIDPEERARQVMADLEDEVAKQREKKKAS